MNYIKQKEMLYENNSKDIGFYNDFFMRDSGMRLWKK